MATGCAFFDYDNDGWMDIFILGGRRLKNTPPDASNRLYKNNRDGTFTDVTAKSGLGGADWAQGVCVGDYNNDGFEDLFLTYYGQNRLITTTATAPSPTSRPRPACCTPRPATALAAPSSITIATACSTSSCQIISRSIWPPRPSLRWSSQLQLRGRARHLRPHRA